MNRVPYILVVNYFVLCYVGTLCEGHGEFFLFFLTVSLGAKEAMCTVQS